MTKEKESDDGYIVFDFEVDNDPIFVAVLKEAKRLAEAWDKEYPKDAPHRIYKLTEVER